MSISNVILKANAPSIGEQIRINHEDCPAGTDTKQRLYIKIPEDNSNLIIGYCHNCGEHGTMIDSNRRYHSTSPRTASQKDEKLRIPDDAEFDIDKWPGPATAWVYQYGFTSDDLKKFGWAYLPNQHRVLIPICPGVVYEPSSYTESGYQLRRIVNNPKIPKYTTAKNCEVVLWSRLTDHTPGKTIVICEDALSAKKIDLTDMRGLPLLGTHASKEDLFNLSKRSNRAPIVVWLDNDSEVVSKKAKEIAKFLSMVHEEEVYIVDKVADPKMCGLTEIRTTCEVAEHVT